MNEQCSKNIYNYFLKARQTIISFGYGDEIEWCQNRHFNQITPDEFFCQYTFAVLCSSGLSNQIAKKMEERFFDTYDSKGIVPAIDTIKNSRMRDAIALMVINKESTLKELSSRNTDYYKIEFLQTLKQIGKKEKFHLARNLGIDCVKPDIHMERLAASFGFESPDKMCREIQKYENERLGVIDLILWRYCNLTGEYQ